ncbi:MAG: polysaccharide deacetylase family protein [Oscillospiraceae bacterium]|nr:polysaccharide deacetylase family protein [Oscillospiraceae bacterium]
MFKPIPRTLLALLIVTIFAACAADNSYQPSLYSPDEPNDIGSEQSGYSDMLGEYLTDYKGSVAVALTAVEPDYKPVPSPEPSEPITEPEPATESSLEPPPEPSSEPLSIPLIDPSRPMVALTFDDGPSKHTTRILDVLEQTNARATFFTIGNLIETRRDTVFRAFDLGCEIVGHSWDHSDMTKLSEEALREQLIRTNEAVEAVTGIAPVMYRPPYGAVNDRVKRVSADLGFAIINWSVDPWDWKVRDADSVYNAIMKNVKDRAIILSHDLYGTTADAMERVIPELIAQGYQLVTVSELLSFTYDELEPGKVYTKG